MNEKKNEKKKIKKDYDLKNKDDLTACKHSTPHSAVRHFLS